MPVGDPSYPKGADEGRVVSVGESHAAPNSILKSVPAEPVLSPAEDARVAELVRLAMEPEPLHNLMHRFAQVVGDVLEARWCGLAVRSHLEQDLTLSVSRRDEGGWSAWQRISRTGENGGRLASRTQSAKTALAVDPTTAEPLDDKNLAQLGVVSALVGPVQRTELSFGTLGVYYDHPRVFSEADKQFIGVASGILASLIERHLLVRRLKELEEFQSEWVSNDPATMVVLNKDGKVVRTNPTFEELVGYTTDELKDRHFATIFAVSIEGEAFARTVVRLVPHGPALKLRTALLDKKGNVRHTEWSFRAIQRAESVIEYIGNGIDMTSQEILADRAQRAEAKAKTMQDALATIREAAASGDLSQIGRALNAVGASVGLDTKDSGGRERDIRRAHTRHVFRSKQVVAPVIDGRLPSSNAFFEVECVDLSAGGISFLLSKPPATSEFIIAVGVPGDLKHMRAEVRNCRPHTGDDRKLWRVGCKFTERVQIS